MTALGATDEQVSALTTGVSQVGIRTPPIPRQIEIPFVQVCAPQARYRFSTRDKPVSDLITPYESVKFISLDFSVEITGQQGRFEFAATTFDSPPVTDEAWLGATVYQRFAGNSQGDTFATYTFPTSHPFGLELKAVALGNDPPRFYFRFNGSSGDVCRVRGLLTIQGGGRGIMPAYPLAAFANNKSASPADSVVSNRG